MSTIACPVCGTEYESWSTKCADCGVALVGMGEPVDPLELPESEQVIYELGAWPVDAQGDAGAALAEAEIPHGWAGTDLVVHVQFEADVDAILEDIERSHGLAGDADDDDDDESGNRLDDGQEGADGVDLADELGGEGEVLAYTLDEWRADERARLTDLLVAAGVEHRWEAEVTLLVAEEDEERVEAILDAVEYPDALPADGDLPAESATDADPELLGTLFLAADRLKANPMDAQGLADLIGVLDDADPDVPPYGFAPSVWRSAMEQADELADLIADETDRSDEVLLKAIELRELLRPFV